MIFTETKIKDVYIVEPEPINDERGFFARIWCKNEFRSRGLNPNLVQISIAYNAKQGTIRGMHYQLPPNEEAKLVSCSKGAIYDVVIDLRSNSRTYKQWINSEISESNRKMIYVPEGCAHGYQTLIDNTEVIYHMSNLFAPQSYAGIRWDDPVFRIKWIYGSPIVSPKDSNHPNFEV